MADIAASPISRQGWRMVVNRIGSTLAYCTPSIRYAGGAHCPPDLVALRSGMRRQVANMKTSVARVVRPQDFVWLFLFSAPAYVSTDRSQGIPFLLALAALQVIESKVEYFSTQQGNIVSILLKLAVAYVLIGNTGGLTSSYYLILLLPLVSAATTLGQLGSVLFTLVCCGAYVSFILYLDPTRYQLDPEGKQELFLRLIIFAAVG